MQAQGLEVDKLRLALNEILDQSFLQTATWGLEIWEKEYGLPVNESLPSADRKAKVMAAINGVESCTLGSVKRIIKSFTGIEPTCFETDGSDPSYPYTIRRRFMFVAGFSRAGDDVWGEDYEATLMLNVSDLFRAGYSKAGDAVYGLDIYYIYLDGGNLIDKNAPRSALEKVLPARMRLIIN